MVAVVFETHSISEDNEHGVATGWVDGRLSERGRALAAELGARRRVDGIEAVFTSDLRRAAETAEIAFSSCNLPVLHDWRLRECNYGEMNGMAAAQVHGERRKHLDTPYPGGESWREAIDRVDASLDDVLRWWEGKRVLIVGHVATRWSLDVRCGGMFLEELAAVPFDWQEGWEYCLEGRS